MRFVRASDSAAIEQMLEDLEKVGPTYSDIGATLVGRQPDGFRHDRYETLLGNGAKTFRRAVMGLQRWEAHRLPGVRVFPDNQEIRTGATVVVVLGTPVVALAAPCRIVGVIDGPRRWGFAYGTLPGHPENGEEAFVVSISPDQVVRFDHQLSTRRTTRRLVGPIGRAIQRGGTVGYGRALKRFVDKDSD